MRTVLRAMPTLLLSNVITLPDRTTQDQRAPRLSYLQISPSAVDLRTAPATIHVSLGANDDRPGLNGTLQVFDSAGKLITTTPLSCPTTFMACDFDLTLPQRTNLGPAREAIIVLTISDSAGRIQTYGQPNSPPWPSAVSLLLQPTFPDALTKWGAAFPGYAPNPSATNQDTDGDGFADLIEFALGTDPTQRSVPPAAQANLILNLSVPLPFSVPSGTDLRSHRLPSVYHSSQNPVISGTNLFGFVSQTTPPTVTFAFTPTPHLDTLAWENSRWRLYAESTPDLTTWNDLSFASTNEDSAARINLTMPAEDTHRWFRLRVEQLP